MGTSCGRRAPTRTTATAPLPRRRTSASRSTSSRPARRSSSASRTSAARSILPERTGPIADVLYSAAGNSADDGWYRKGIIAYSFETGADRILNLTTGTARRRSASSRASARSAPAAARAPARPTARWSTRVATRRWSSPRATSAWSSPPTTTRWTRRRRAPRSTPTTSRSPRTRSPTASSGTTRRRSSTTRPTARPRRCPRRTYNNQRARSIGEILKIIDAGRDHRQVVRGRHQGQPVRGAERSPSCSTRRRRRSRSTSRRARSTRRAVRSRSRSRARTTTGGSGIASCVGSTPSGSNLPTGTAGMQVLTITATDNVGNVTVKTVNYRVLDATNANGGVERHRAGDAGADAGHSGLVRRVHAGRGDGLHGDARRRTSSRPPVTRRCRSPTRARPRPAIWSTATFSLPQPLQVKAAQPGWHRLARSRTSAARPRRRTLLSYAGPDHQRRGRRSTFKQHDQGHDALRTGTYSKTLTFTLSTTTP